ncbi:MAG TPA: hypothetical protein PLD73_01420 [Candidatus Hydrogenedentes bacterium]|nr:hypothetical protein [Candidatus Hydrogenedentota bacterium]
MGFLKQLMIRVGADTSAVDKELKRSAKEVQQFGKSLERVGATMTKAVTLPIIATGAAALKLGTEAMETEDKFKFAFGSMEQSVRKWSEAFSETVGLDSFSVRNTAADFMVAAKGFGIAGDEAAKYASQMTEAAFAIAEVYEQDDKMVQDAIISALKGRTTQLKELGIVIDDNTTKAYAYAAGIAKVGEELNATQQAQAIMGQVSMHAQDEMEKFAEEGKNWADRIKNQVTETFKRFGTSLLESGAFDKLLNLLNRFLLVVEDIVNAFAKMDPKTQDFLIWATLAGAAFGPIITGAGKLIGSLGTMASKMASVAGNAGIFAKMSSGISSFMPMVGAAVAGVAGMAAGVYALDTALNALGTTGAIKYKSILSDPRPDPVKNPEKYMPSGGKVAWEGMSGGDFKLPEWKGSAEDMYNQSVGKYETLEEQMARAQQVSESRFKQMMAEMEAQAEAEKKRLKEEQEAEERYQEKLRRREEIIGGIRSAFTSLAQSMRDAGKSFMQFTSYFEIFQRETLNPQRLVNRMKGQLNAMIEWQSSLANLSKRGVAGDIMTELRGMGPGAVDQIGALARMDDAQLNEWLSMYRQRQGIASTEGDKYATSQWRADQVIENMTNNITINEASDPEYIANLVVKKLRLAGVR